MHDRLFLCRGMLQRALVHDVTIFPDTMHWSTVNKGTKHRAPTVSRHASHPCHNMEFVLCSGCECLHFLILQRKGHP